MAEPVSQDVAHAPASRQRRNLLIGATAVVAAIAGGVGGWLASGPPKAQEVGQEIEGFWQLQFATPTGKELRMADLRGKPVLLNFWATWCPPCVEELPLLDAFFLANEANGWQVVGLAIDQPSAVRQFLERAPLRFPVGLAGMDGSELSRSLGNLAGGLPFTAVFGKEGKLQHRKIGRVLPEELQFWKSLA